MVETSSQSSRPVSAAAASPAAARMRARLARFTPYPVLGTLTRMIGVTAECRGLDAELGELCVISRRNGPAVAAEAIGFRDGSTVLMPLADLDGVRPGDAVRAIGRQLLAPGGDELLGRVLDGIGRPLDDKPGFARPYSYPVHRAAPSPSERCAILDPCVTGVRALDGLLTLGRGQRIGIFAGAGVGKSTLLAALSTRSNADVTVIGLVGERGREVYDFVRDSMGPEGMKKAVVVAAPSDAPPLQRLKAPYVATAIAESFQQQGKHVLLVMDSITRFAAAAREVGLALGEPPTAKGYPPSLFSHLPRLVERPGNFAKGSITAIYTVLVEGDDLNDPVADSVRSLLDGHVVLARSLAERGHFPAIDVLASVSRLMPHLVKPEHMGLASKMRRLLALHRDHKDLIDVGAYKPGADKAVDESIKRMPAIEAFLRQDLSKPSPLTDTMKGLEQAIGGAG